ncbi:MAG TPA: hypothetical protein DCL38_04200 [Lachnospiraceae bacterium]|nr:hypothetical protein [Lachnospiraceae bacterium]
MDVIYEDGHVLAVFKEAGMAVQTADIAQKDLISEVRGYLKRQGETPLSCEVVHRLDQPVSGIVVFGKDKETVRALNRSFAERTCEKRYLAVVEGSLNAKEETRLSCCLRKDPARSMAVVCNKGEKGAAYAELLYKTVEIKPFGDKERSLLSIRLCTGRFHQIRAQLSDLGHPITGDRKYGYVYKDALKGRREGSKEGALMTDLSGNAGSVGTGKRGIALMACGLVLSGLPGTEGLSLEIGSNSPKMLDFLNEWF